MKYEIKSSEFRGKISAILGGIVKKINLKSKNFFFAFQYFVTIYRIINFALKNPYLKYNYLGQMLRN